MKNIFLVFLLFFLNLGMCVASDSVDYCKKLSSTITFELDFGCVNDFYGTHTFKFSKDGQFEYSEIINTTSGSYSCIDNQVEIILAATYDNYGRNIYYYLNGKLDKGPIKFDGTLYTFNQDGSNVEVCINYRQIK